MVGSIIFPNSSNSVQNPREHRDVGGGERRTRPGPGRELDFILNDWLSAALSGESMQSY